MKNTKMKKFLAVVLSAALVAGLAAGCGSKEDGKEEDKGSSAKTAKVIDVDLTNEEYAFGNGCPRFSSLLFRPPA